MNESITRVLQHKGSNVETVGPDIMVLAAVQRMNERKIGALLVVDKGATVGIFTERDVLVRVVAAGLDPKTTPVHQVMTREPITVGPHVTVNDALLIITQRRCRHLPVIDDGGLRGLISIGDLTSWLVREQQRTITDLHDYVTRA